MAPKVFPRMGTYFLVFQVLTFSVFADRPEDVQDSACPVPEVWAACWTHVLLLVVFVFQVLTFSVFADRSEDAQDSACPVPKVWAAPGTHVLLLAGLLALREAVWLLDQTTQLGARAFRQRRQTVSSILPTCQVDWMQPRIVLTKTRWKLSNQCHGFHLLVTSR